MADEKIFLVRLGDWSQDGHNMFNDYYVMIPTEFSREQLFANYHANAERFGFSPFDFANEYEDSQLPERFYNALLEAGLDLGPLESYDSWGSSDDKVIEPDDMLNIVMFFFGDGLAGFHWRKMEADGVLVGEGGIGKEYSGDQIGYGLYFN